MTSGAPQQPGGTRLNLTDALVHQYLLQRGFRDAAEQLPAQAKAVPGQQLERQFPNMEVAVQNRLLLYGVSGSPDYGAAYAQLRDWVHGSLDLYKVRPHSRVVNPASRLSLCPCAHPLLPSPPAVFALGTQPELMRLLYPVLVHCYLQLLLGDAPEAARELLHGARGEVADRHQGEVDHLLTLQDSSHVAGSAVAQQFLNSKFRVQLSSYSCTLLMAFLQARQSSLLLALVNERLHLQQVQGHPSSVATQEVEAAQHNGLDAGKEELANTRRMEWGILDSSPWHRAAQAQQQQQHQPGGGGAQEPGLKTMESRLKDGALPSLPPALDNVIITGAVEARGGARVSSHHLCSHSHTSPPAQTDLRSKDKLVGGKLPHAMMYTLSHAADVVCCATTSRTGHLCVAGCNDGQLRVWNMFKSAADRQAGLPPSGTAPITLQGHAGPVYDVAFTPAEDYILSCGADGTARLWSTELRSQIAAYSAHSAPVWCLAPAPRGHYFATGSFDRTAAIWALDSGHPRRLCVGHAADVDAVAWHPSCNYIATGSSDRSVRLWDVASGECVRLLPGHGATPRSLAFCPDGRILAAACDDGAICLWDLGSARRLAALPPGQHGGAGQGVTCLSWSAEGTLLASGGADGSVRIWDAQASRHVAQAKAEATRKQGEDQGPGKAAAQQGPVALHCAKVLPTRCAQIQTVRFTYRNLLYVIGSR
jgi:transcription initiation factor TFIID subunit 5